MHFTKSASGWVGPDHSHDKYSGKFPNQKISVHDLLGGDDANSLPEQYGSDHMRYFHFPTNKMRWIEVRRYILTTSAQNADQMPRRKLWHDITMKNQEIKMISNDQIKCRKQRNFYIVSSGVVKYTEAVLARDQFMQDI